MTARATEGWASPGIAAQAVKLRRRLTHSRAPMRRRSPLLWPSSTARRRTGTPRAPRTGTRSRGGLPLAIAETAADTAALAAVAADRCVPRHRADAVAGAALAEGATRAAALLVETNLLSVPGDDRSSAPARPSRRRPRPVGWRRSAREPADARVEPAGRCSCCCGHAAGMAGVRHPRMGDRRLHRRGRERVHRGQRRGRWAPARRVGERRRRGAAR